MSKDWRFKPEYGDRKDYREASHRKVWRAFDRKKNQKQFDKRRLADELNEEEKDGRS